MYKVTLSMPIYNVAPYVERALISALNQTFESIEYLIVDDRGTDNSMDIVRKIVAEHPRGKDVRIIEHPYNIGTGATKNTAIDNAKGKYLFFMDSDDEITSDCIEVLYKAMMEEPVDFVAASYDKIDMSGNLTNGGCYYKNTTVKGKNVIAEKFYSRKLLISGTSWNKLYLLSFFKENNIRCFPHHINEDAVLFTLVFYFAKSCKLVSNVTLKYYQRENSTEYNRFNKFSIRNANEFTETCSEFKKIAGLYENTSVYDYFINYLISIISRMCFLLYNSRVIPANKKKEFYKEWTKLDISLIELMKLLPFSLRNISYVLILRKLVFVNLFSIYRLVK